MEDIVQNVVMAGLGIAVSAASYAAKKILDVDKLLSAHIAADGATFVGFDKSFKTLEEGQSAQSEKLDRLIEHMLKDK